MMTRRISALALVVLCAGALLTAGGATAFASAPSHGDSGGGWDGGGDDGWDGGGGSGGQTATTTPQTTPQTTPPTQPPPSAPEVSKPEVSKPSGPSIPSSSGTCDLRSGPVPTSGAEQRNLQQVPSPSSRTAFPCPYPADWRGIRLNTNSIRLVAGGQLERQIPFAAEGRAVTLPELTEAIGDPDWLAEVLPGVFELKATFVQSAGTVLEVSAPRVNTLRLVDRPGVALSGSRAAAVFDGVVVTSWDEHSQAPDISITDERPFVVYQNASQLDIARSTFQYLGSDRTSSYGVSWRNEGTTGNVTDSVFEYNFFGIYTYQAAGMHIERNTVRYNVIYGIDPHDYSTGLVISDNNVYGNGSHGIIFSKFVVDSVVANNFSHENAGNGIMMDAHSDRNLIENNTVTANGGEGIVASSSADLMIRGNRVDGSEVGVRISHPGADRVKVVDNTISDVETGIKIYDLPITPTVSDNTIYRASVAGARIDAPGATFIDNRLYDARVGYDARSVMTVDGGAVIANERALDVASGGEVTLVGVKLVSHDVGIRKAPHAKVIRTGTNVDVRGSGVDSTTERTLSLVGIVLVVTALLLQLLHSVRNRRWSRHAAAPIHVRNLS